MKENFLFKEFGYFFEPPPQGFAIVNIGHNKSDNYYGIIALSHSIIIFQANPHTKFIKG